MFRRKEVLPIRKGDERVIRGWVMYDWSNSVYQLTIASTVFPIYYNTVTRNGNDFTVDFFGAHVINTVLYSWTIAAAASESAAAARQLVQRLLSMLSPEARMVITLLEIEEKSVKEIAKLTGWSVPLVKVRAFRARAEMRKCLARVARDKYV